ncbi:hypothetical protein GJ688_15285 [Heliobacillus mobilis]|uniref:Uncharacterized protein n=1 Tax=Heliobacterium mobile TaxID=28064 RepID=A0A6I3SMV2_HELMO|nr:hypothetical protein [Heliobacterium mobile]MTV50333.1 hypothetical protein [Heliobacterium mobile]
MRKRKLSHGAKEKQMKKKQAAEFTQNSDSTAALPQDQRFVDKPVATYMGIGFGAIIAFIAGRLVEGMTGQPNIGLYSAGAFVLAVVLFILKPWKKKT